MVIVVECWCVPLYMTTTSPLARYQTLVGWHMRPAGTQTTSTQPPPPVNRKNPRQHGLPHVALCLRSSTGKPQPLTTDVPYLAPLLSPKQAPRTFPSGPASITQSIVSANTTHLGVERAAAVPVPRVVAAPVYHQDVGVRLRIEDIPVVCTSNGKTKN